jgi:hypothetical protein
VLRLIRFLLALVLTVAIRYVCLRVARDRFPLVARTEAFEVIVLVIAVAIGVTICLGRSVGKDDTIAK